MIIIKRLERSNVLYTTKSNLDQFKGRVTGASSNQNSLRMMLRLAITDEGGDKLLGMPAMACRITDKSLCRAQ